MINFKKVLLPLFLLIGLLSFFIFGFDSYLSLDFILDSYREIKDISMENFIVSLGVFSFLYFLAIIFSIPAVMLLTIISGAIFGYYSFLICLIVGTLGSWVVFIASKGILYDFFRKKVDQYIYRFTDRFRSKPLVWLITLRFIPLLPIWVGNIIPAILGLSSKVFLTGTFLGLIPGTLIFITFGRGVDRLIYEKNKISFSIFENQDLYFPLFLLFLISMVSMIVNSNKDFK